MAFIGMILAVSITNYISRLGIVEIANARTAQVLPTVGECRAICHFGSDLALFVILAVRAQLTIIAA